MSLSHQAVSAATEMRAKLFTDEQLPHGHRGELAGIEPGLVAVEDAHRAGWRYLKST